MEYQVMLIMGSESDRPHAEKITAKLDEEGIPHRIFAASAHKQPKRVLEIIEEAESLQAVLITIAGRSNALSGFVAANSTRPVIACPPFSDKTDMLVNIHSTLQMPSSVPAMAVLDPGNAALAAARIISFAREGKS